MISQSAGRGAVPVEVHDPNHLRSVMFADLSSSATVAEVRARAVANLRLPDEIDWNLRDERSGRLLHEDQRLDEFIGDSDVRVELALQPDAALG